MGESAPDQPFETEEATVVVSATPAEGFVHRDNTFGTPEEDAFRRDFTVNALFYDVATKSVIDYVGGLEDLQQRVIRSIGDPHVRFVEDPVRMFRAAVFAARLGFDMDEVVLEAIARHRELILKGSPARLMEEYYKVLRSGYAEAGFRALQRVRLLELLTPELRSPSVAVWESLGRLDAYRQRFQVPPRELTNTILAGTLLMPMGALVTRVGVGAAVAHDHGVGLGMLAVSKRDFERLRQLQQIVPRLGNVDLPPRVARGIAHRPAFNDALTWLEIHGDASPDLLVHWRHLGASRPQPQPHGTHAHAVHAAGDGPRHEPGSGSDHRRRRRRRRRRRGREG